MKQEFTEIYQETTPVRVDGDNYNLNHLLKNKVIPNPEHEDISEPDYEWKVQNHFRSIETNPENLRSNQDLFQELFTNPEILELVRTNTIHKKSERDWNENVDYLDYSRIESNVKILEKLKETLEKAKHPNLQRLKGELKASFKDGIIGDLVDRINALDNPNFDISIRGLGRNSPNYVLHFNDNHRVSYYPKKDRDISLRKNGLLYEPEISTSERGKEGICTIPQEGVRAIKNSKRKSFWSGVLVRPFSKIFNSTTSFKIGTHKDLEGSVERTEINLKETYSSENLKRFFSHPIHNSIGSGWFYQERKKSVEFEVSGCRLDPTKINSEELRNGRKYNSSSDLNILENAFGDVWTFLKIASNLKKFYLRQSEGSSSFPKINDKEEQTAKFNGIRNPALLLNPKIDKLEQIVENDYTQTPNERIHVIWGPNAGGKSMFTDSVMINYHLAQKGLPVFAQEGSEISIRDNLISHVITGTNVQRGASRHLADLLAIKERVFETATPFSLVSIDEPYTGTATVDGHRQLAENLGNLYDLGVPTIVSTHYHETKDLVRDQIPTAKGMIVQAEHDSDGLNYSYKVVPGFDATSEGLYLANSIGMDYHSISTLLKERAAQEGFALMPEVEFSF